MNQPPIHRGLVPARRALAMRTVRSLPVAIALSFALLMSLDIAHAQSEGEKAGTNKPSELTLGGDSGGQDSEASGKSSAGTASPSGDTADAAAKPSGARKPAKNDPTQPSDALRNVLNPKPSTAANPRAIQGRAVTAAPKPTVPSVAIKARIVVEGKPAVAMLDVDGAMLIVREGVSFTLHQKNKATLSCSVTRVDADSIVIRLVELEQELHVQ